MQMLHILSSVDPRGGGPMEALRQCGLQLESMGHSTQVLTLDDPKARHVSEFPLPVCALGPSRGKYAYNPRLAGWLRENSANFDAVIVHGLWQYHGLGAWRALHNSAVPYFVFPHGMLDPWFKSAYPMKHLKKWLYWPWADYRLLRDARAVLFTCEEERLQARRSFGLYRANEAVVDFGTNAPPGAMKRLRERFLSEYPHLQARRLLLFLGRIHEKKGCDLLIEAFARVAGTDERLHLVIAGPDQTDWIPQLRALAQRRGIVERVDFPGMLSGDSKWGAFYASEAFVLPSHQENFGVAVAEALGCGLPVLISNRVNIWREIEADRAGLVAPDTIDGTERMLRQWLAASEDERSAMRNRARESFERRFTADAMARSLIQVIQGTAG
jgi:glycosyltransferase involved in cell wall biosynthesis